MAADADILATVLRIAERALTTGLSSDRERGLRDILAAVASRQAVQDAVAPAERIAQKGERLLAEFDRLGGGRDAASIAARNLAADKRNTLAIERDAQRIRAMVRRRKSEGLRLAG